MNFLTSRIRAFESLADGIAYHCYGLGLTGNTHLWIFRYRLWHGRYPTNQEIHAARKDM